ncbi:hypothetical protein IQ06DRAFT_362611 [Phaeosphaeriaceae sp. SRC1lsM3a]|nr:hypothetical protein IQ06DRAFT_362611 [Stagonospora sp. SRC1lsM3a]
MAPNPRSRTAPRIPTASPYTPTPPPARRAGVSTRGIHVVDPENTFLTPPPAASPVSTHAAAHYSLAATVPSPFTGTLDASLDLILDFGREHADANAGVQTVVDTLLRPVDSGTNWPILLRGVYLRAKGREMLEEILFLVTRTLLPEQVAENREMMARMYERKKHLAIRMVLRYDMLREWNGEGVASVAPPAGVVTAKTNGHANANGNGALHGIRGGDADGDVEMRDADATTINVWKRRELMPNIIATLIAAPEGGWTTHAVRERMKHHPTSLDTYMLLSDEAVSKWSDQNLLCMTAQIALQWQWLRNNNEMFAEMEVYAYEDLEGKADECDWIVDDARRRRGVAIDVPE